MELQISADAANRRTVTRTSLYLAASLYCDGISTPVKIRNISSEGALLDSAATLATGALVQLVRGSLIVHGLVSWSENCRCGIRFSGSVDVQQWRMTPVNAEQQRIDDVVGLIKAGAVPLDVIDKSDAPLIDSATLSDDLQRAVELLENCGDRLAKDSILVALYPSELQNLDIAMQVIAAVGVILSGSGDPSADRHKFASLRKSAGEALARTAT